MQEIPAIISSGGGEPLGVIGTEIALKFSGANEKTKPIAKLNSAPSPISRPVTMIDTGALRVFITMSDYS
jgi:hypothetical protein